MLNVQRKEKKKFGSIFYTVSDVNLIAFFVQICKPFLLPERGEVRVAEIIACNLTRPHGKQQILPREIEKENR